MCCWGGGRGGTKVLIISDQTPNVRTGKHQISWMYTCYAVVPVVFCLLAVGLGPLDEGVHAGLKRLLHLLWPCHWTSTLLLVERLQEREGPEGLDSRALPLTQQGFSTRQRNDYRPNILSQCTNAHTSNCSLTSVMLYSSLWESFRMV